MVFRKFGYTYMSLISCFFAIDEERNNVNRGRCQYMFRNITSLICNENQGNEQVRFILI